MFMYSWILRFTVSSLIAGALTQDASAADLLVYLGTNSGGAGRGLSVAHFDTETGALTNPTLVVESPAPAYFAIHPDGRHLYAANASGFVSAFVIDPANGALKLLNQVPSGGKETCYISLDQGGKHIFTASYDSGNVAVWEIDPDFSIGKRTAMRWHTGGQGNPPGEAHSHSIVLDPGGRFAVGADLGFDRLFVYRFDDSDGSLTPADHPSVQLPKGAGPRHVVFHPNGKWAYVSNESANTVTAFSWDGNRGETTALQTISTLPQGLRATSYAAEIALHPNGRFLYVSNRGHDSIAEFSIDPVTGKLAAAGYTPTRGKNPRNFAIDPKGRWMLVTNHLSGNVAVFRVDPETGVLKAQGEPTVAPEPFGVRFVAR
ncbi:MAG TPA: lactonase family protein [Gemmataceae bacterium]|nr:lactonase family protein [Gemmataceae bacterium]